MVQEQVGNGRSVFFLFQSDISRESGSRIQCSKYLRHSQGFSQDLHFTQIEFCLDEWSTGAFTQAKGFYEKNEVERYKGHLADIELWARIDLLITENIRRKWFKRSTYVFLGLSS